jgi:hypothetical protein
VPCKIACVALVPNFLKDDVPIDTGTMRGRDVLIHIAMLPVTLAIAGTLIGLIWWAVGSWS